MDLSLNNSPTCDDRGVCEFSLMEIVFARCIAISEESSRGSTGLRKAGEGTWVDGSRGIGVDFVGLLKQGPIEIIGICKLLYDEKCSKP